ncbi:MAG: hypothetical protein J2P31_08955, partial [Blastocatellia bacterium]|nr:hypothetical protein [Blastocatellia bacterium]
LSAGSIITDFKIYKRFRVMMERRPIRDIMIQQPSALFLIRVHMTDRTLKLRDLNRTILARQMLLERVALEEEGERLIRFIEAKAKSFDLRFESKF